MTEATFGLGKALQDYVTTNGVREPEPARRLRLETERLAEASWQSSAEQVQLMTLLARTIDARSFLEIGTFTGYCTLWMALTLPSDGTVVTCDIVDQFAAIGRPYWRECGVDDRIDLRLGEASDTMEELAAEGWEGRFDIAYIDANKKKYPDYYEGCHRLVRRGGLILVDNMFWSGAVVDPHDQSKATAAIRATAEIAARDERVDVSLVPIGDGLLIARKR